MAKMEAPKMGIVFFDNQDVIATSYPHMYYTHFKLISLGGAPSQTTGYFYEIGAGNDPRHGVQQKTYDLFSKQLTESERKSSALDTVWFYAVDNNWNWTRCPEGEDQNAFLQLWEAKKPSSQP